MADQTIRAGLAEHVTTEAMPTLAEVERQHIERVLAACHGKVTRAARILGIARATLYRRLAEYQADQRVAVAERRSEPR